MVEQKSKGVTGTRGQILGMLRLGPRTVSDMAGTLHVTENAVRAHLTAFETDGLVRRSGRLPGARKPFLVYSLTPKGDELFPKAYGPCLAELLRVLEEKLPASLVREIFSETGKRMAKTLAPGYESLSNQDRIKMVVEVLTSMGGVARASTRSNVTTVEGLSCPIADAVGASPHACQFTQSLISTITGMAVSEQCQRTGGPRCCFALKAG